MLQHRVVVVVDPSPDCFVRLVRGNSAGWLPVWARGADALEVWLRAPTGLIAGIVVRVDALDDETRTILATARRLSGAPVVALASLSAPDAPARLAELGASAILPHLSLPSAIERALHEARPLRSVMLELAARDGQP